MSACHGTNGIEIYITTERLMILDCQPLLSSSIMDRLITQEKKFTSDYKYVQKFASGSSLSKTFARLSNTATRAGQKPESEAF